VLDVQVNSTPLHFLVDTGNRFTLVDIDVAEKLHLDFGADVPVKGNGARESRGAFIKSGVLTFPALPGYSNPITLAIPLHQLSARIGVPLDGLLGSDFLSQFIVEIDYEDQMITLHDREMFRYTGSGESVPVRLTADGHPIFKATVVLTPGSPEVSQDFVLDLGASQALRLNAPLVAEHHLPPPGSKTFPLIGVSGVGGNTTGDAGRITSLRIGARTLSRPITDFSRDNAGAAADSTLAGNIGYGIASRFRLFLDYAHNRIIFEPNTKIDVPFERAFSGVALEAQGAALTEFRVAAVAPESAGSRAGIVAGDIILTANGTSAQSLGYERLLALLREAKAVRLRVQRGNDLREISLTPESLP